MPSTFSNAKLIASDMNYPVRYRAAFVSAAAKKLNVLEGGK